MKSYHEGAVPVGSANISFKGMITLNERQDLLLAIQEEY